jgi:hypothetical protein
MKKCYNIETSIASVWCQLGKDNGESSSVKDELIWRAWLLILADVADFDGDDLMEVVQHQRICDLTKLKNNCPLFNLIRYADFV